MQALLVDLAILAAVLTAVLWSGSLFFQSSWYTTPTSGIGWRAPLAAGVMTGFFLIWALLNISEGTTTSGGVAQVPYGLLWEFSNRIPVVPEPVPFIVSKRWSSEPAVYKHDRTWTRDIRYKKVDTDEYWDPQGIEFVEFNYKGQHFKFEPDKERSDGYIVFVDADTGYEMREYEIGKVSYLSESRLLIYALLNGLHFVLWVACFWLLLGFDFWRAFAFSIAMWLLCTLTVFPILVDATNNAVVEQSPSLFEELTEPPPSVG